GCGPCHMSIPFLKQLVTDYKNRDFQFVSIETWSKKPEAAKRYQERNGLNFKFLRGEGTVTKAYQVNSVPVFFLLDEKRVIRKVIAGYGKDKTDQEIVAAIEALL
ncbi:MAG TPA: TlpA disulfide reductase family protein, partial [Chitinophagaceae bacterium]